MAQVELLTVAATAANSADFTVAAGGQTIVHLTSTGGFTETSLENYGGFVYVDIKQGSTYHNVGVLKYGDPAGIIQGGSADAVFRLRRPAGPAIGAFSN